MQQPAPPARQQPNGARLRATIIVVVGMIFVVLALASRGHGGDVVVLPPVRTVMVRPAPYDVRATHHEPHDMTFAPVDDEETAAVSIAPNDAPPPSLGLQQLFRRPVSLTGEITKTVAGEDLTTFKQIHHGIYKCVGGSSRVTFALKTECRPAQKWHGQQGWTEVAVHHFARLFFGAELNTVPPAAGMVVLLTATQKADVHRDGCGLTMGPPTPRRRGAVREMIEHVGHDDLVPLVGVGLEWRKEHNDEGLQLIENHNELRKMWLADGFSSRTQRWTTAAAEAARQISDIMVLDYILENEDREEKNWFTVPATPGGKLRGLAAARFVAMDNGWAFIGRSYKASVCELDEVNLLCPPLLRRLSRSSTCRSRDRRSILAHNCRFRQSTVARLREFVGPMLVARGNKPTTVHPAFGGPSVGQHHAQPNATSFGDGVWGEKAWQEWRDILLSDPLVALLLEQYGHHATMKSDGLHDTHGSQFSDALARFIQRCPVTAADAAGAELTVPALPASVIGSSRTTAAKAAELLLRWLGHGITVRMVALLQHVDSCVAEFGESAVFLKATKDE